jgi:hypothetical protein
MARQTDYLAPYPGNRILNGKVCAVMEAAGSERARPCLRRKDPPDLGRFRATLHSGSWAPASPRKRFEKWRSYARAEPTERVECWIGSRRRSPFPDRLNGVGSVLGRHVRLKDELAPVPTITRSDPMPAFAKSNKHSRNLAPKTGSLHGG